MNPKKFGTKTNHNKEPWKLPLPQYIEKLYFRNFKKPKPDIVSFTKDRIEKGRVLFFNFILSGKSFVNRESNSHWALNVLKVFFKSLNHEFNLFKNLCC
ncbi:MAG: hypothetical protein A2161_03785 [Candidatus Schekmanbacteria bacterium RBG_13_48_7]|uniref:Uncharacterized protein n=1 Tax=Candidatus Schekmanbacteria bacterium RBG_13_48_7 TaxID=1817878 RepID=A0A1F7S8H8_9BACT|nr:MAG: hypothetical protein A2161_03785 [Candidatus Schekmanbacteria bacterium RBG_13_48_7]